MDIASALKNIKSKLPPNVSLVAVSKTKPNDAIIAAYQTGHRIFGENKVQELVEKYEQLPKDIKWHFIGHLQTNKVKYIAPFISMIHAVDSLKLLKAINKEAGKNNRVIDFMFQLHIATEETKFGLSVVELDDLINSTEFKSFSNVNLRGLMGMATFTDNLKIINAEFASIKNNFDKLKSNYFKEKQDFSELSIGMSSDYEIALAQGSTMVRIGSTIFGSRH